MEARRGRRFFLFFHTYAVHDPYVPPVESAAYFDDGTYRGPVRAAVERLRADRTAWADAHRVFWDSVDQANPDDVRFVGRLYDGGIRDMDGHVVASILDRLDRMGVADDSLVVLTSDHGEAFGEHGRFLHGDLYGETLRVPLVLRFPGRVRAGMRVEAPVRLVDVMPTILDLVGVPAPAVLQGQSVAGYLDGDPARAGAVTDVPSEFSSPADGRVFESMRRGSLTYIVDRADERLFDREADPDEHRDVAAAQPAALGAMRASLATWRDECARLGRRFGPRDEVGPSAATTEQLRALGYVR
jgi:arylsulfatase A-like enzyme